MIDLTAKAAIVTGASRGIGRAVALALAKAGANVALIARSEEPLKALALEIEALGQKALAIAGDVGDAEAMDKAVKAVKEAFGAVDILVSNAGVTRDGLLLRMREEDWDEVLRTNLRGAFNLAKAASRHMIRQAGGGRIITIASVSGITGNAGQANYAASKAGLIGFTKSVAKELASRNVLANVVAPGFCDTDMTASLPAGVKAKAEERIPLGRFGSPEDVANAVLFLASPLAAYITGEVLRVDGGLAM